ncbi:SusC/RagA family TonB-linked outer membrane protein [Mucilaginibacter daejeonensis]|uniref:SusC/RagA family TonB-linked outer membrane protein n=1 Tax=Mucilaginibacter daejeonensis TaxID=398049 RepID=UPI001D171AF7|nr:SusC/RagA family TonB-linked outer membrane protein [Mucilaginibacter daejeonensis]UEG54081.1 SusC/RagA family TonB-linked outer membrane protein [Mucilaginibacter daejeonensis]
MKIDLYSKNNARKYASPVMLITAGFMLTSAIPLSAWANRSAPQNTLRLHNNSAVENVRTAAADITVNGTVLDENGQPLAGVSVKAKNGSAGTMTDGNGRFKLTVADNATLVISYIGYQSTEVAVEGRTTLSVRLNPSKNSLNEVVVTSLGIKREAKALGYSVGTVTAKEVTQAGATNFGAAIYGKVAGVQINSAPGGASSATNIQIRGINSLYDNRQPLYVVDGVIIRNDQQQGVNGTNNNNYWDDQRIRGNGMLDINPADIESISILKGASASALYGSDAASGVIVITTKKGVKGRGLGVDFNYAGTIERAAFLPKYQTTYGPGYDRETNTQVGADAQGWIADPSSPSGRRPNYRAYSQFGPAFDGSQVRWWDGSIRTYSAQKNNYADVFDHGYSNNYNLGISNQTDKINYRLSATRLDYKGTNPGSKQNRNTFNLNSSVKLSDKISTDIVVNYINTNTHNRPYLLGQVLGSFGGFFNAAEDMDLLRKNAMTSQGYKYSTLGSGRPEAFIYNIRPTNLLDFYWNQDRNSYDEKENRLLTSATINWDVVKHLKVRTRIGNDYTAASVENKMYNEYSSIYNASNSTGGYSVSKGLYSILYGDGLLTYSNKVGDLDFSASGGFTFRNEKYSDQNSSTASGLVTENFFSISNSYAQATTTATRASQLKYAYLGILNLSYKNFLFVEGTARQEYASTLPPGNNSYFYPSVNSGFVFSEAFKMPEFVSYGKLRASYGIVANDVTRYKANIAYTQTPLQTINGSALAVATGAAYGNLALRPEKKYEQEYGAEMRFFKNRVGFDVAYYTNKIKDQILPLAIAPSNGATSQIVNVGDIANHGLELSLSGTPFSSANFKWNTRINYAFNRSKLLSLAPGVPEVQFYNSDQNAVKLVAQPGEMLGNIYVYPIATNAAGQRLISDDGFYIIDKTKYVKAGNIMPKAIGGIVNSFTYKNFSIDFTTDYRFGGQMISTPSKYLRGAGMFESTLQYRDAAHGGITYTANGNTYNDGVLLQGVNANTGQPNTVIVDAANYYLNTYNWGADADNLEGSVYNNSYVKLREAVIGYRLPASVVSKLHLNNVRISLIGRNLFYIYKTLKYVDPEAPVGNQWFSKGVDVGSTAPTRSFGLSLNANF